MKHFTSTAYVVARVEGEQKVLLHLHKKLHSWLPPGGHVEENESPEECALREVGEETGLQVELLGEKLFPQLNDAERCTVMLQPACILVEKIEENHYHMDFTFFATTKSTDLKLSSESHEIKWFGTFLKCSNQNRLSCVSTRPLSGIPLDSSQSKALMRSVLTINSWSPRS